MSFKKLIPIVFLIVIFVIAATFLPPMLGSVEAGASPNISQDYKTQMNASAQAGISALVIVKYISIVLAILAVIITATWLIKKQ